MSIIYINPFQFAAAAAYDPDAQSYITAVETADGQALEVGVKDAINAFVVGCKADGIWSAIKASCILRGARTLAGIFVPLVGPAPTNNNFVAGDYDRKTGLLGDGSTKYLDSNRANNADPQDSKHLSVYVSSVGNIADQYLIAAGGFTTPGNSSIFVNAGTYKGRVNVASGLSSATINSGVLPTSRLVGVNRSGANYQEIRAGSTTASNAASSVTPTSESVNIFAGPSIQRLFSNSRLSFYSIGESLDLALLDARVSTLMSDLAAAIP